MKSKTKKLFLSMFAFASLAITACGGGGNSSSSGGSASGDTSSETSSGGSQSSEDSSTPTQVTKLFVSVDDVEAELTYSSGSYSIGPVELEEDQVLKIYTKDASGTPVSILGDVSVETISFTDWFDVGEGQVTVKVSGTYSFEFEVDGEDYNLTVEKAGEEVTEYQATLTEGVLGDNLLVHVFNFNGGEKDVIPNTYGENLLSFEISDTDLTHFIVVRLKPGEDELGEKWCNVEKQSDTLALSDSNVNFTWKASADDNYHLWGTTDGENWGELGKFTLNESVYSATVTLAKGTEFVFHLEKYSDDDSGWRNFADLVGTGVSGNFKKKSESGTDSNNIIVETAGEYTFTVTNEHKIQVGSAAPTPVPTKSGIYIRGTVVSGWDVDTNYELEAAESSSDRLAYIEGVTFTVGEFKLGDATWSAGHEWGWEYDSHNTVIGEAAANFKKPNEATNYNIECTVPGTYDLYLMKNNYISIKLHDETPHVFKAYLGSDEITKVPTEDQENPSNKAEFVKNVTTVEGTLSVKKDDVAMDIYAVDNVPCAAGTKSFDIVNTGEHKIYVTSEEQVWIVTPDYPTVRNITATFSSTYSWFLGDPNVDIYAYYWGTSIDAGWVKATFTSSQATFELPNEAEGFLLTRCYKGSTLPDWWVNGDKINRIYNKSEDVVLTASNNYEVPVPENNTNNGPVRLIKVTRGSDTFNLYANVKGSGDSTEYYAENISLQAGDKLSAINNETGVPYEITVKDGCKTLYPSTGVVADGQYDVYINVSNQFWIQEHSS